MYLFPPFYLHFSPPTYYLQCFIILLQNVYRILKRFLPIPVQTLFNLFFSMHLEKKFSKMENIIMPFSCLKSFNPPISYSGKKLKHINIAINVLPNLTLFYFWSSYLSNPLHPRKTPTILNNFHFTKCTMSEKHSLFLCLCKFCSVLEIYLRYCSFQKDFFITPHFHQIASSLFLFYHRTKHKLLYFLTHIRIICACV